MGQLNGNKILSALVAFFSPTKSTFADVADWDLVANTYGRMRAIADLTDSGTAGTAQTATTFFTNDTGGNLDLSSALLLTPVAVAADAANNVTVTLSRVDAAGANATTMATYTSDVAGGATVAGVPKALTISTVAGARVLPSGWSLRIAASKAGTGVAIAAATSQAYLQTKLEPTT